MARGRGNSKGRLRDEREWRRGGPWGTCKSLSRDRSRCDQLNAVNIDCPNTSKQRERVGAHDAQLQPAVRYQYTKIPKL